MMLKPNMLFIKLLVIKTFKRCMFKVLKLINMIFKLTCYVVLKDELTANAKKLGIPTSRDGSGPGESGYSSKPVPFGPGMNYTYWTVDVYGDTRINPHGNGGGDGLTLTLAPYPPRPLYPLNK